MRHRCEGLGIALLCSALLVACAGSGSSGTASRSGFTTTITVPALWAAEQDDGSLVGGIEPAQVIVDEESAAGYSVDLSTIAARGAGKSWKAATASAAAFATIFAGVDPRQVGLTFTITGPIDGPSAGGLLTVGLLAAFRHVSLRDKVTMTGTISPDGSIGPVGYIPTKMKAAADAGYTVVGYPADAARLTDTLEDGRTLKEYATSLGIEAVPLRSVGEAYALLTGAPSYYPAVDVPPMLAAGTLSAAQGNVQRTAASVSALITSAPKGTEPALLATAQKQVSRALTSTGSTTNTHEPGPAAAENYGALVFAGIRLARDMAAVRTQGMLEARGFENTRTSLIEEATSVANHASRSLEEAHSPDGSEAMMAEAAVQSAAVISASIAGGMQAELALAKGPEALIEAARVLALEECFLDILLPNAEAIVSSLPSTPMVPVDRTAGLMDEYSSMLVQSANADVTYLADVLHRTAAVDGTVALGGIPAGLTRAQAMVGTSGRKLPGTEGAADSPSTLARAMAYVWFASAVVADGQNYGSSATSKGVLVSASPITMMTAVRNSSGTVYSMASLLAPRGVDAGAPVWSTQWVSSIVRDNPQQSTAIEAEWLAQRELWTDDLQVLFLNALIPAAATQ